MNQAICGRFAPSATGELHFGSLVAAEASFLHAKSKGGRWLIRIEDIDRQRCTPQFADLILQTLASFELHSDAEVVWQSKRLDLYNDALSTLINQQEVYICSCSRRTIAKDIAQQGGLTGIYPHTCRKRNLNFHSGVGSTRLYIPQLEISFNDIIQGYYKQDLANDVGDFILRRRDGQYNYQLAVVVDDYEQGITQIIRGCDLLDNTPRQIYLQHILSFPKPDYAHLPVALNSQGQKLSKQTKAKAINIEQANILLWQALVFLGQNPPQFLYGASVNEVQQWALQNWSIDKVGSP
ncbi:MAG: tRNA glutamyl-Q(34) synthetase GluQRS [Mariprofundales bacterium]